MVMFSPQHRLDRPLEGGDHTLGNPSARLTLVQYGDYQCPYTARTIPVVAKILNRAGDDLWFAYRHFPLADIPPHAQQASEAAEAAAQGKSWKMHETLFQRLRQQDERHLDEYAESLGLDTNRYRREMDEHAHAEKVQRDRESGKRSGVESTPTFYMNGVRYDGPNEIEPLMEALRQSVQSSE
ncbi:MAG: DsbA family protein [Armatimonadetes bacterium]|nr:DsbA family protein [Armatimonadota bacterium]